jgi:DNA-binding MarR family transcriptional regulator
VNAAGNLQPFSPRERLETFLGEVNALAIRLRHPAASKSRAEDLPAAATAVLQMLQRKGPLTVPQIARLKFTSRQNIQTIVNRLKVEGAVRFLANPAHKRSELVCITENGELLLANAEGRLAVSLEQVAGEISESEILLGLNLVRKMRLALNRASATQQEALKRKVPDRELESPIRVDSGKPELQEQETETQPGEQAFPVNLL